MISSLYRFRSLYWLLDQGELEKQEIYFAKPEQLNDPMEGFRDIFWKGGDQVVTIPVRRNELAAYFQYIHFFALATIFQTHVEHGLQPKREQVSDFNERLRKGLEHANLVVEQVARLEAEARTIIGKLEDAIAGMAELLDTLFDINQIDAGAIKPDITDVAAGEAFARLSETFATMAAAKGLELRIVPSSAVIRSDRQLFERMLGNLLSNAIKYTDHGRLLLGCRRSGGKFRIEVWDTGIGIPKDSTDAVFEEFYRLNPEDSAKFGLGLGLYIVQRFASFLDRPDVIVADYHLPGGMTGLQIIQELRSALGGQVPALIVSGDKSAPARAAFGASAQAFITKPVKAAQLLARLSALVETVKPGWLDRRPRGFAVAPPAPASTDAAICVIDDDPGVRDAMQRTLQAEGYQVATYPSGETFLADHNRGKCRCLVVDVGLSNRGLDGLEL
jgi:DNA-binding response OmpR family regulator